MRHEWPNGIVAELKANHNRHRPINRKEATRRSAAIQQYMRDRLISKGEAEQMYAEHGIYAPKWRFRR